LPKQDEVAFTSLIKRLKQQERAGSAPAGHAFVESRAKLAASLDKMNSLSVAIQGQERLTASWLDAPKARGKADSNVPIPTAGRLSFIPKSKLGYVRTALAVAVVSAAGLGLAGYALFTHDDGDAAVVAETSTSPRAAPEDTPKGFEAGPTMVLAAVAASSDSKLSDPLLDQWRKPQVAKPESLAKPGETPSIKAPPADQDIGASERLSPKRASRTLSRATEDALLVRASRQLSLGDIAGARSIFKNLAYQGSERAALAMAETYDQRFLQSHSVVGMKPDPAMAREWYEKAASLGSENAARRLGMLK
jgi:hypothetical protein